MDRRWLARLLLLVTGVAAGFLGTASFALGTCHSSGGFCADEFSSTHVTGYAGGALLLATATGLVAAALSLRLRAALVSGAVAGVAVAVAAALLEVS